MQIEAGVSGGKSLRVYLNPTLSLGYLFFSSPGAREGGKMRDPAKEVD